MKLILVAILITLGGIADSLHLTGDELAAHQPLNDIYDPS
jgi:hypothetical protein